MIKDLEAMIEFVPFTSIQPSGGESANGVGDVEATLAYLVLDEKEFLPAIAVAGEVKFPTANNNLIGNGEFDYRPILIFSKRIADIDLHFWVCVPTSPS